MILLLISFFAGILTILAPCVLPVLPVIIGGSIGATTKDRWRPYIIAGSLAISIVLFTLLLKTSTLLIGLSPAVLTTISGGLVIALGLVAMLPKIWEKLVVAANWQATSQRFLGTTERNNDRYIGPILVGVALGPVFASCSPTYAFILASVLPHRFLSGIFYLIAYSLGLVVTLLVVSLLGRRYIRRFPWALDTHSWFRRGIGILFIAIGLVIITGQEVRLETWVAARLPFDETAIERLLLAKQTGPSLIQSADNTVVSSSVLNVPSTPAPEFLGLTDWINSSPLTIAGLKGKVILVDFWTYSCINCIRTLPYIEKWYQTYKDQGFVVVGVNTPEFAFEHNPANVRAAVKNDGLTYPVALDNNYDTWGAYSNNSWPADYLIDKDGNVRYTSIGEGDYNKTEQAIQDLLGIHSSLKTPTPVVPISADQTPETYFGANRRENYAGSSASPNNGITTFTPAHTLSMNEWTIGGKWKIMPEYITSEDNSALLTFNVTGKDVYVVASSKDNQPQSMRVGLSAADAGQYGNDATDGTATISSSRLYHIVSLKQFGTTTVTLSIPPDVSLYTFTFGS
jgi:cytochrome c biogenesis protein CcdA/thiol-disulfide isomerase/thioredoxin